MNITVRTAILSNIKHNWDNFDEQGVSLPVLGYELCIDIGASPPVCCQLIQYGIYESKAMTDQIEALNNNKWIRDCKGAWGYMILIAPKSRQDDMVNIKDFVWRLCMNYCGLNRVTTSFMFPIPRCADSIEDFGDSNGIMFLITLGARQGYY